jgi:hypothetical protein
MSTSNFTQYVWSLTVEEQQELAELLEAEMETERQKIKEDEGSPQTFQELRIQHGIVLAVMELGWHADN